jgi:hypothetical protein
MTGGSPVIAGKTGPSVRYGPAGCRVFQPYIALFGGKSGGKPFSVPLPFADTGK